MDIVCVSRQKRRKQPVLQPTAAESPRRKASRYRKLLDNYTNWFDQAKYNKDEDREMFPNVRMEWDRNHPWRFLPDGKKWLACACRRPNLNRIEQHLRRRVKEDTLFVINGPYHEVLLCLCDIDSDDPDKAQALAELLCAKCLAGRGYIEPSCGLKGRHVYFKLQVDSMDRLKVRGLLDELAKAIKLDPRIHSFQGAHFCSILGHPTIWGRDGKGRWSIQKRGSVLKCPYCPDFNRDLEKLATLQPIPAKALANYFNRRAASNHSRMGQPEPNAKEQLQVQPAAVQASHPPLPSEEYMRVTTRRKEVPSLEGLNGLEKKRFCVTTLLRELNRPITVEEALAEYVAHYHPTGFTPRDCSRRERLLAEMVAFHNQTFIPAKASSPYCFRSGRYLDLVNQVVPVEAFSWSRREKLDHERLADFVGVKIQDAFSHQEKFLRAGRDATITNMRVMREKGLITWSPNSHVYKRLLEIATGYGLLAVYEEHVAPMRMRLGGQWEAVTRGLPRLIGPGPKLEEYQAFQKVYEGYKRNRAAVNGGKPQDGPAGDHSAVHVPALAKLRMVISDELDNGFILDRLGVG